MELQIGKMTSREIAAWFGVSYSSYSHKKSKYLNDLKEYATFETTPRGVNIKNIYISEYIKPDNNYRKIKDAIPFNWNKKTNIDLKKNVAQKIQDKREELKIGELKFRTTYNYVCKASNELYGKPNELEGGEIGNCHWVLCVKEKGELRWFTMEEFQKKMELRKKYFKDAAMERNRREEIRECLAFKFKTGDITEQEYKEELFILENSCGKAYGDYLNELQNSLGDGCYLAYGIVVEEDNCISFEELASGV